MYRILLVRTKWRNLWPPCSRTSSKYFARLLSVIFNISVVGLTKKAEPPPTRGANRDSGTDSANGGWLRRLVRPRSFDIPKHCRLHNSSQIVRHPNRDSKLRTNMQNNRDDQHASNHRKRCTDNRCWTTTASLRSRRPPSVLDQETQILTSPAEMLAQSAALRRTLDTKCNRLDSRDRISCKSSWRVKWPNIIVSHGFVVYHFSWV